MANRPPLWEVMRRAHQSRTAPMTPELSIALRQSACRRAHQAGAEAARLEAAAREARRLYFRELATCDLLGGHPTPFDALG